METNGLKRAVRLIKESYKTVAFTGAGISVESGVPDFRGPNGLWSKYDPKLLELSYFYRHPEECWEVIKKIFYDFLKDVQPNDAHLALVWMEEKGLLQGVITQNIDNLHFRAGSKNVVEYHGNTRLLYCRRCDEYQEANLSQMSFPPICENCGMILKPDFVFFGEPIPLKALQKVGNILKKLELMLVIGTTGVVYPAGMIPRIAQIQGAKIIEVNTEKSEYTEAITDIFIQQPASKALRTLKDLLSS